MNRLSMRRWGTAGLVIVPTILSILYFALFACAPAGSFRPATPMVGNQRNEMGWGLTVGGKVSPELSDERLANADLWYYHQFAGFFDFGVRLFGGTSASTFSDQCGNSFSQRVICPGFGVGPTFRFRVLDYSRFRAGLDLNLGWAWLQFGIPAAVKVHDLVWLYTQPQMSIIGNPGIVLGFPVGVALRATRYMSVLFELSPQLLGPKLLLLNGGAGLAFRF